MNKENFIRTDFFKSVRHACEELRAKPDLYAWFKDEMERVVLVWRLKSILFNPTRYYYIQGDFDFGFTTLIDNEGYKALEHADIHRNKKEQHKKVLCFPGTTENIIPRSHIRSI